MFNLGKKKATDKKTKQKVVADELSGIHIYKDDHNRYIYYDVFTSKGYVINNIPSYKGYSSRFVIGFLAGILAYSFELGYILPIIIGIGAYLFMEVKFRMYLKKQTMLSNFKREERPARLLTASNEETKKICLKAGLYVMFALLIIILPFTSEGDKYDVTMKTACVLIGIGALGVAIFQFRALSYKKRHATVGKK